MTGENYLRQMEKVEIVIGLKYGDERLMAMREFLEHIPDDEWEGVVKRTVTMSRTLPTVADFCRNENRRW